MTKDLLIILAGLFISRLLFFRFPLLGRREAKMQAPRLSVIIPARNEEENIALILEDLKKQTAPVYEIICVDDASADGTAAVAASFGVSLISLKDKPEGWIGKSWACQNGADAAGGDILLFLDADVRLGREGIGRLLYAYEEIGCTISVQPYHTMEEKYEQLSMFFNMVQIAATGLGLPTKSRKTGLFGPVILMSRSDYYGFGGHESIKGSIIDDMAIGSRLKSLGMPFRLFLGDGDISFRMYAGGIRELMQGWTKNQSAGAMETPPAIFAMVFLWITACISVTIQLALAAIQGNTPWLAAYLALYIAWILELRRIAVRLGSFDTRAIVIYPVLLVFYIWIFALSAIKKIFRLKVTCKDRGIRLEK
ncbi:MAG TPA: glycosyltransferase family 2 protein [Clostridiaceae bacterium]|nr:glycosyltransferase family 2 protein [Clostridiaceae bacterium]